MEYARKIYSTSATLEAAERVHKDLTPNERAAVNADIDHMEETIRTFAKDHNKRVSGLGPVTLLEIYSAIGMALVSTTPPTPTE